MSKKSFENPMLKRKNKFENRYKFTLNKYELDLIRIRVKLLLKDFIIIIKTSKTCFILLKVAVFY